MTVLPPLTDILDLEQLEQGLFLGPPVADGRARVFGGQVLAQALAAACFTVDGWPCHSLHSYFLRPGKPGRPIHYEVTALRDGRRFAARQVLAIQRDEPVLQLSASFQGDAGRGDDHQARMPQVPGPDELPDEETQRQYLKAQVPEHARERLDTLWPIEVLAVDERPWFDGQREPGPSSLWFRCRDALPEYRNLHRCALTYASDFFMVRSCAMAASVSAFDPDLQMASLDHSLWFHRDLRADDWLLFVGDCDNLGDGRGLARGSVFATDGTLVASVAQECLLHMASSDD